MTDELMQSHGFRLAPRERVPLYHQLYLILRAHIYAGQVKAGELLPGELDIVQQFGVSRITAKRALDELAAAGLVARERGRGTRVLAQPDRAAVAASVEDWLESAARMGRSTRAVVHAFDYGPASEDIAVALDLSPGAIVQRAVRVRHLDGGPMSLLVTHVPEAIGRSFAAGDLERDPLLHLLERGGVEVASARQTVSATLADAQAASLLEIDAGAPLIDVRRVVRDRGGRPVEHIRALYRPDRYRIDMAITRIRAEDGTRRWSADPVRPAADSHALAGRPPDANGGLS